MQITQRLEELAAWYEWEKGRPPGIICLGWEEMTELRGLNYHQCGSILKIIDVETAEYGNILVKLSQEDTYLGVGE